MKHITFNRIMIAIVLLYFPIASYGSTGSFFEAIKTFGFLVALIMLGVYERKDFESKLDKKGELNG